ncbi:hypothetical protein L210DRAFT_3644804 [Boletus edulis BED1]|uniref:F-box domain-containing protein n=1 Tax=Boletus edulis BED1 TaxID=1328754 RepID=A0AAD4BW32_BOLED|nr:hypothetical protein L210DRAFT_3644804 [Boletus edulis BED1]
MTAGPFASPTKASERSLKTEHIKMPKHHVDPITGATHVKFLEHNINDDSREKTFCITRVDLTLLEPCAADVLPLQMAVDTQPLNFPEDGHVRGFYFLTTFFFRVMHHALQIPEILLKIFGQDILNARDLAAIARTCRAFKEPALDVLWSVLKDVSPLARCLSDVSRRKYENNPRSLPAIEDLAVGTPDCPPGSVGSFFSALETACINHSITQLSFDCGNSTTTNFRDPILTFDDVRPMMAFSNLHHLDLDVSWDVGLTDDDLVKLASAWPYLEHLGINTCPSLCHLCLAVDTRGYTQVSPDRSPATLAFQSRDTFCIDVVDSVIEEESVQAMATYLAGMATRATRVWLYSWGFEGHQGWRMPVGRLQEVYKARWKEVYRRANLMRRPRDNSSTVSCRIL